MKLPEDFELLAFFGVEPTLRIPNAPWEYNGLTFDVSHGNQQLMVHLETDVGEFNVSLRENGEEVVHIELKWVGNIALRRDGNTEVLIAQHIHRVPDLFVEIRRAKHLSIACIAKPQW